MNETGEFEMSKKTFTEKEISLLSKNPYVSISPCNTLEELKKEIKNYMTYYNHYRYQWDLKKMTPVQYRDHLLKEA